MPKKARRAYSDEDSDSPDIGMRMRTRNMTSSVEDTSAVRRNLRSRKVTINFEESFDEEVTEVEPKRVLRSRKSQLVEENSFSSCEQDGLHTSNAQSNSMDTGTLDESLLSHEEEVNEVVDKRILRSSTHSHIKPMIEESDTSEYSESEDDEEEEDSCDESDEVVPIIKSSSIRTKKPSKSHYSGNIVENYFSSQSSKSAATSSHTVSLPKMDQATVNRVLSEAPNHFQPGIDALYTMYRSLFNYWLNQLGRGFNILLYGYGSKLNLIDEFRNTHLSKTCHLVVNGFFPGLTIKQVLNQITSDLLEHSGSFKNLPHQCKYICTSLCEDEDAPKELFLIIHNIDGAALREEKSQISLSLLAACPRIHIIASIDHLNSPLLWTEIILARYNWIWHDATTFERYSGETSYENSLLSRQSGALALSSLTHVLKSLTPNAKGIFEIISNHQLDHKGDPTYLGLAFGDLYQKCREKFLVNSDATLRAQLTEFRDHKLLRSKRGQDGTELLTILVETSILEQFINQGLFMIHF